MTLSSSSNTSPAPTPRPTVREAVLRLLRHLHIDTVFGNPGSTELPMFRDFPSDFRYVLGLQESVVVGMADGYAQATGNAALVNLHSAAGVGHAMGNIFTAFKNQTPLIVTAGQQARSILPFDPFLSAMQATDLPKPYVKWACEPARAEDVPRALARAYHVAMQAPRGPVFVSIPADDWDQPADHVEPRQVSRSMAPDPAVLCQVADALNSARRPAIVAGTGVDRDGAMDLLVQLAERHRAPVYTAPMSARCAFPETHRLFGGFLPAMRERIVEKLAGHDLVLVLGGDEVVMRVTGAESGGGAFFDAKDAAGLEKSMNAALRPGFEVLNAQGQVVASGIVGGETVAAPSGSYTVRIKGRDDAKKAVEVKPKETTSLEL